MPMKNNQSKSDPPATVFEKAKNVPVLFDADVVVAGSGISSTFASIAAARNGARTVLVERFAQLGGNIGPGIILMGSMFGEADLSLPGGLPGIAKEFMDQVRSLTLKRRRLIEEAQIASHVAWKMNREAGVEVLFSAYASDPIMNDGLVQGLFVECKSGRKAVKAKVTIDGTGDADIALRAGAPMIPYVAYDAAQEKYYRNGMMDKRFPTFYNDTQITFIVAGVDFEKYHRFCKQPVKLTDAQTRFAEREFSKMPKPIIPMLLDAVLRGEFNMQQRPFPNVNMSSGIPTEDNGNGLGVARVTCAGALDSSRPEQISYLEGAMREQAMRAALFARKYLPGFENSFLLRYSEFLGGRGGPCIKGEYVLTTEDRFGGKKFNDVIYRNTHLGNPEHGGDKSGFDVPYRICLPQKVDGLLVCARGASYTRRGHDPCAMRCRPCMMVFGQCVGTAAALCVKEGVTPKTLDVKKLQKKLIADGIYLGEKSRLKKLKLI